MEEPQKFFISFNSHDQQQADWIAWTLKEAGHEVAVHTLEIPAGGDIPVWMNNRLAWSDRLIAVISPDYATAVYSMMEWTAMIWRDPTGEFGSVIPVIVRPTPAIPPLLRTRAAIDLTGIDKEEATKRLVEGVNRPRPPRDKPAFEEVELSPNEMGPVHEPQFEHGKPRQPDSILVGTATLGDLLFEVIRILQDTPKRKTRENSRSADYLEKVSNCLSSVAAKLWTGVLAHEECESLRVHLEYLKHVISPSLNGATLSEEEVERLQDRLYVAVEAPAKILSQLERSPWAVVGNPMEVGMPVVVGTRDGVPISLTTGEHLLRELAQLQKDCEFETEKDLGAAFTQELWKIENAAGMFRAMADVLRHL